MVYCCQSLSNETLTTVGPVSTVLYAGDENVSHDSEINHSCVSPRIVCLEDRGSRACPHS